MNFYKRFIGDIQAKTGGLTLAEFGAYDRLLDHYYSTEQPIPADKVHRICRAMSAPERAAVDSVLSEFFELTADGYVQAKADEVIAKAQPLIEAARANGKKGGRPKKPKTQPEPSGFQNGNPYETQEEPSLKASQSQSQTPSLRSGEQRASRLPKPFELPDDWRAFCQSERPDLDPDRVAAKFADFWHGKPGKAGTKLDWLATWRNWVREERASARSATPAPSLKSFAASDREAGMQRWEQMTGRTHPDRASSGHVIDADEAASIQRIAA